MKIQYLYHSGYLMETGTKALLFDYYRGGLPDPDPALPLYVFASHAHQDHFQPEIFSLAAGRDCRFLLSRDIPETRGKALPKELSDRITFLGPGECYEDERIRVDTLPSTDEGIAFLVRTDKKTIFHAGDLNDWHWEGEPDEWNDAMHRDYLRIIEVLRGLHIDIAFIPLDPRLEAHASQGLDELLAVVRPDHIFPMHFADENGITASYAALHPELSGFHPVTEKGQCFAI